MSSIDRPLHADLLLYQLDEEEQKATKPETLERDGRSSRTLVKDGPLRVTLIVLAPGGGIPEHTAQGPVTIQPLRGEIEVTAGGEPHTVNDGGLLSFEAGVPHSVRSETGAAILLTVAYTDR